MLSIDAANSSNDALGLERPDACARASASWAASAEVRLNRTDG
jgi:hypothetical protein